MEKIYIERSEDTSLRTNINRGLSLGTLRKGIVYEEFEDNANTTNNATKPKVLFFNNPSKTSLTNGSSIYSEFKPLEVDGTKSPNVKFYLNSSTRAQMGNTMMNKMKSRMTAGHQTSFANSFNNLMQGGTNTSNNAFAYLRSNIMPQYM